MIKIEWLLPGPSFSKREMGSGWLTSYVISVLQDEKVLEICLYNMNILITIVGSEMVKIVNSMLFFLKNHNFKITWKNENIKCYFIKKDGVEKSHSHQTKYMQYFILDMQVKLFQNLLI